MMRAIRLAGCVLVLVLTSCCCDDDDCWWTTECYWSGCCYVCYEVEHCDHYYGVAVEPEDLDFDAAVRDGGDGKIDIFVTVSGKRADGVHPLSVRLIGPEMADFRRESPKTVWGFHGVPISAAERIEVGIPGTDDRVERDLFSGDFVESLPCDPGDLLGGMEVIPEFPEGLALGTELPILAPLDDDVSASVMGLEVEVFPPEGSAPEHLFLRSGEASSVRLDLPGRWTFRSTLIADDLCEGPSADSAVVEETGIEVR